MNYNHKITDLIYRQKKLVSNSYCKNMIDLFEKNKNLQGLEDSYKYDSDTIEYDNYKAINLFEHTDNTEIKNKIIETYHFILSMLHNYKNYIRESGICKNFDIINIQDSTHLRLIKYEVGSYIKDHTDQNSTIRGSISINLNKDYKGGSLKFFGDQYFVDLDEGEGIFFPAEPIWIHGTTPITEGNRYVLNCFLRSKFKQ